MTENLGRKDAPETTSGVARDGGQSRTASIPPQERSFAVPGTEKDTVTPCTEPHAEALNAEIRHAIGSFNGKWKLEILWLLSRRVHRFNELRRALPGVTQHTLTRQLRELERDGMVRRTVYPAVPPHVEYAITDKARRLAPVFDAIFAWAR